MKLIGITGGICSGKTTVSKYFKEYYPVIDCDKICTDLYKKEEIQSYILSLFGKRIMDNYLKLDKAKLRSLIFNDSISKELLTNYLHPLILNEVKNEIEDFKLQGYNIAFIDAPLLFECEYHILFDFEDILVVTADYNIRAFRASKRDGLNDFEKIYENQLNNLERLNFAPCTEIYNNGSLEELYLKLDAYSKELEEKISDVINKEKSKIAAIAGSFDPFHYGHKQLIDETIDLYDELVVIITHNKNKKTMYSLQLRQKQLKEFIEKTYPNKKISIILWDGLLMDCLKVQGIEYLIRGIRSEQDLSYETMMYYTNKALYPSLKMHYIISDEKYLSYSSSTIKELLTYNKDVSMYTPIVLTNLNPDK